MKYLVWESLDVTWSDPAGRAVGGDADKSLHSDSNGGVDRDSEEDLGDGKEPGNDVR